MDTTPDAAQWTQSPLEPFGLLVEANTAGSSLEAIEASQLARWTDEYRLVVLRGFAPLPGDELATFCTRLGTLLDWSFGSVNELKVQPDAKNYLFTKSSVPFHWDGAFVGRIPHYIFFSCETAPGADEGGETLFCDSVRLLQQAPEAKRREWEKVSITYSTEKMAHYGGSFSSPLLTKHPTTGEEVVRYAEPVNDLNPVYLEISGIEAADQPAFLADMHARLHSPACCRVHNWQTGDFVLADNHALLHGRRAFTRAEKRHIRRVNVL